MEKAFEQVYTIHETEDVSMRTAALMIGIKKVSDATQTLGMYP
jgi:glutamate dehydrogenase/leucine dehydrogenase